MRIDLFLTFGNSQKPSLYSKLEIQISKYEINVILNPPTGEMKDLNRYQILRGVYPAHSYNNIMNGGAQNDNNYFEFRSSFYF